LKAIGVMESVADRHQYIVQFTYTKAIKDMKNGSVSKGFAGNFQA
jgi:hypothetical protein